MRVLPNESLVEMPYRVLVVDADPETLAATCQVLSSAGYLVSSTSVFEEAKQRLLISPPDLLIADVRLGAYNGVHLVVRARADQPDMPAIVSHATADPVLEVEARRAGACYVVKSPDPTALLDLVSGLLTGRPLEAATAVPRRWPRKRAGVAASLWGSDATVLDVSYGGLRLEVRARDLPEERLSPDGEISFPLAGFRLRVRPVWAKRSGLAGPWWCGVEIADSDQRVAQAWRGFVDSLIEPFRQRAHPRYH